MPLCGTLFRYENHATVAESVSSVKGMRGALTTLRSLEEVAAEQPVGVSLLSRRLGVSKSAAQRALQTLFDAGWIRRSDVHPGRWVLTGKVIDVAGQVGQDLSLRETALPSMHRLVESTTESAHLAVLDGADSVVIEEVESTQVVRIHWPIGNRAPAHACATGRAMLAALPEADVEQHLPNPMEPLTAITITDPDHLAGELHRTAQRGYAVQHGELRSDIASIAAAICLPDHHPVAAVSVFLPAQRFPEDGGEAIGALVREAATHIAGRLSGPVPPGDAPTRGVPTPGPILGRSPRE